MPTSDELIQQWFGRDVTAPPDNMTPRDGELSHSGALTSDALIDQWFPQVASIPTTEQPQTSAKQPLQIDQGTAKDIWDAFEEVRKNPLHIIPYLNAADLVTSGRVLLAARAYQNGTATQSQQAGLQSYLADQARPESFGYKVVSGLLGMIPFMGEILGATSGVGALASLGKGVAKGAAKAELKEAMQGILAKTANFITRGKATEWAAKAMENRGVREFFDVAAQDTLGAWRNRMTLEATAKETQAIADRLGTTEAKKAAEEAATNLADHLAASEDILKKAVPTASSFVMGQEAVAGPADLINKTNKELAGQAAKRIAAVTGLYMASPAGISATLVPTLQRMMPEFQLTDDQKGNINAILANEGDNFFPALLKSAYGATVNVSAAQLGDLLYMSHMLWGTGVMGKAADVVEKMGTENGLLSGPFKAMELVKSIKGMVAKGMGEKEVDHLVQSLRTGGWEGYWGNQAAMIGAGLLQGQVPHLEDLAAQAVSFAAFPAMIGMNAFARGQLTAEEALVRKNLDVSMLRNNLLVHDDKSGKVITLDTIASMSKEDLSDMSKGIAQALNNPQELDPIRKLYKAVAGPISGGIDSLVQGWSRLMGEKAKSAPGNALAAGLEGLEGNKPVEHPSFADFNLKQALEYAAKNDPSGELAAKVLRNTVFADTVVAPASVLEKIRSEAGREGGYIQPRSVEGKKGFFVISKNAPFDNAEIEQLKQYGLLQEFAATDPRVKQFQDMINNAKPETDLSVRHLGSALVTMNPDDTAHVSKILTLLQDKAPNLKIVIGSDYVVTGKPEDVAKFTGHDASAYRNYSGDNVAAYIGGAYNPDTNTLVLTPGTVKGVLAHEIGHIAKANSLSLSPTSELGRESERIFSSLRTGVDAALAKEQAGITQQLAQGQHGQVVAALQAKIDNLNQRLSALDQNGLLKDKAELTYSKQIEEKLKALKDQARQGLIGATEAKVTALNKELATQLGKVKDSLDDKLYQFGLTDDPEHNVAFLSRMRQSLDDPRRREEVLAELVASHFGFYEDATKRSLENSFGLTEEASKQLGTILRQHMGGDLYQALMHYGKGEKGKPSEFGQVRADLQPKVEQPLRRGEPTSAYEQAMQKQTVGGLPEEPDRSIDEHLQMMAQEMRSIKAADRYQARYQSEDTRNPVRFIRSALETLRGRMPANQLGNFQEPSRKLFKFMEPGIEAKDITVNQDGSASLQRGDKAIPITFSEAPGKQWVMNLPEMKSTKLVHVSQDPKTLTPVKIADMVNVALQGSRQALEAQQRYFNEEYEKYRANTQMDLTSFSHENQPRADALEKGVQELIAHPDWKGKLDSTALAEHGEEWINGYITDDEFATHLLKNEIINAHQTAQEGSQFLAPFTNEEKITTLKNGKLLYTKDGKEAAKTFTLPEPANNLISSLARRIQSGKELSEKQQGALDSIFASYVGKLKYVQHTLHAEDLAQRLEAELSQIRRDVAQDQFTYEKTNKGQEAETTTIGDQGTSQVLWTPKVGQPSTVVSFGTSVARDLLTNTHPDAPAQKYPWLRGDGIKRDQAYEQIKSFLEAMKQVDLLDKNAIRKRVLDLINGLAAKPLDQETQIERLNQLRELLAPAFTSEEFIPTRMEPTRTEALTGEYADSLRQASHQMETFRPGGDEEVTTHEKQGELTPKEKQGKEAWNFDEAKGGTITPLLEPRVEAKPYAVTDVPAERIKAEGGQVLTIGSGAMVAALRKEGIDTSGGGVLPFSEREKQNRQKGLGESAIAQAQLVRGDGLILIKNKETETHPDLLAQRLVHLSDEGKMISPNPEDQNWRSKVDADMVTKLSGERDEQGNYRGTARPRLVIDPESFRKLSEDEQVNTIRSFLAQEGLVRPVVMDLDSKAEFAHVIARAIKEAGAPDSLRDVVANTKNISTPETPIARPMSLQGFNESVKAGKLSGTYKDYLEAWKQKVLKDLSQPPPMGKEVTTGQPEGLVGELEALKKNTELARENYPFDRYKSEYQRRLDDWHQKAKEGELPPPEPTHEGYEQIIKGLADEYAKPQYYASGLQAMTLFSKEHWPDKKYDQDKLDFLNHFRPLVTRWDNMTSRDAYMAVANHNAGNLKINNDFKRMLAAHYAEKAGIPNPRAAQKSSVESQVVSPSPDKTTQSQLDLHHAQDFTNMLQDKLIKDMVGSKDLHQHYVDTQNKWRGVVARAQITAKQWQETVKDKDGKYDPNILKAVTAEIEGYQLRDMAGYDHLPDNQTLLKGHEDLVKEVKEAFDQAHTELNTIAQTFKESNWIKYLQNYMPHYWASKDGISVSEKVRKWAETTGRTEERRIPTYADGVAMGLTPVSLDASELYQKYMTDAYRAVLNKQFLHFAQNFVDNDGNHLVVGLPGKPSPLLADRKADELLAYKLANGIAGLVDDGVKNSIRGKLAQPFKALTDVVAKRDLRRSYTEMDSPYESWDKFLVHPDSVNTMKMLLDDKWDNSFWRGAEHFNNWSKALALSFSAFHYAAVTESFWSAMAHRLGDEQVQVMKNMWKAAKGDKIKEFMSDPQDIEKWVSRGLKFATSNDYESGMIEKDLAKAHDWAVASGIPGVAKAIETAGKFKQWNDKKLWYELHGGLKLFAAHELAKDALEQMPKGLAEDQQKAWQVQKEKEIAAYLNAVTGGMDWNRFMWATPKVRQLMHLFMFAPDWTSSNIVTAGLGKALGYEYSKYERDQLLKHYWPAMLTTLIVFPNLIQAGIYAAAGDPDKDDRLFSLSNEKDKEYSVDLTPLTRHLGFGDQRYYMRYGKQAWEIAGWLNNPLSTLMGKSSMAVKAAFEQITGTNTSGWKLPFRDETFWESIVNGDRPAAIASKFLPMSLSSLAEGKPSSFFAPVSSGLTPAKAEQEVAKMLNAYADPKTWDKIKGQPNMVKNLESLVPQIVDAARRNGLDADLVVKNGKRYVMATYYNNFFKALNAGNEKQMEEAAQAVLRLGGAMDGFTRSLAKKYERAGKQESPEQVQQAQQAIQQAQAGLGE